MRKFLAPALSALVAIVTAIAPVGAQSYQFSDLSTAAYGSGGTTVATNGTIYVSASYAHAIYQLSSAGTILAQYGTSGTPGAVDAIGTAARFRNPRGLTLDASGNLYVSDTGNHAIRKITPAGVVTTLSGTIGAPGAVDGPVATARFDSPEGLAFDGTGNLYVADTANHAIRRITPSGTVTTFAGALGLSGDTDGPAATARFNGPQGLTADFKGNLFVADTANKTIRKITPSGVVSLVAGQSGSLGKLDGPGRQARFSGPQGIVADTFGNIFVVDSSARRSNHENRQRLNADRRRNVIPSRRHFAHSQSQRPRWRVHFQRPRPHRRRASSEACWRYRRRE